MNLFLWKFTSIKQIRKDIELCLLFQAGPFIIFFYNICCNTALYVMNNMIYPLTLALWTEAFTRHLYIVKSAVRHTN